MDGKSYKCKRVVRNSLTGETQANVETLGMLEFTKLFLRCVSGHLEKSE